MMQETMDTARVSLTADEEDLPARQRVWPHKPFTFPGQRQALVSLTLATYNSMKCEAWWRRCYNHDYFRDLGWLVSSGSWERTI